MLFGLINVNKPSGISSREAVDRVLRNTGKGIKAGHAGTLDPLASGVLVVCLGPATRLIDYVQEMPKRYRGTFLLGRTSDTEDIEGEVTELVDPPVPDRAAIESAAEAMIGTIQQRPPAYSAIKVAGRRAYKLARQGKQPELQPRPITVHEMTVLEYDYPRLSLDIRCGSGTYVRSLGRDLAVKVGTGAVMSELTRTEIGTFRVEDAAELKDLTAENLNAHILSPLRAVEHLGLVELTTGQVERISNGRALQLQSNVANRKSTIPGALPQPPSTELAAVDHTGRLIAILSQRGPELWRPSRVFVEPKPTHTA